VESIQDIRISQSITTGTTLNTSSTTFELAVSSLCHQQQQTNKIWLLAEADYYGLVDFAKEINFPNNNIDNCLDEEVTVFCKEEQAMRNHFTSGASLAGLEPCQHLFPFFCDKTSRSGQAFQLWWECITSSVQTSTRSIQICSIS
jgi:hypothetical protein